MKKVSMKLFFAVLGKGVGQAFSWFFGLFGYKRDDRFAKAVWRLFAMSAAVFMCLIALLGVYSLVQDVYEWYDKKWGCCEDPQCYANNCVFRDIYFHNHWDGKGYIYNTTTGEKLLKRVPWIATPEGEDSLVCFSNGKKRGYFSKYTGKVVIEPKYSHAWIFSDGLASVEEDGFIKFIDGTGKVIIDKKFPYTHDMDGYFFHEGYCVIHSDDGLHYGLMDKKGNMVLPLEYTEIALNKECCRWQVQKGDETTIYDMNMTPVMQLEECEVYISDGTIDVTSADHIIRKYDLNGKLIHDFYITSVHSMEYEKDEIQYQYKTHDEYGSEYDVPQVSSYRPRAVAGLWVYSAGNGYKGLMTTDGHIVTMPLYEDIEALDHNLYLCTYTNFDKVIVNAKGEIVNTR